MGLCEKLHFFCHNSHLILLLHQTALGLHELLNLSLALAEGVRLS